MRFPNPRYGNPTEFAYYIKGRTDANITRVLRRDQRTIRDWRTGRAKLPWRVPEIGAVLELRRRPETKKPQITDLRLDDFVERRAAAQRMAK